MDAFRLRKKNFSYPIRPWLWTNMKVMRLHKWYLFSQIVTFFCTAIVCFTKLLPIMHRRICCLIGDRRLVEITLRLETKNSDKPMEGVKYNCQPWMKRYWISLTSQSYDFPLLRMTTRTTRTHQQLWVQTYSTIQGLGADEPGSKACFWYII